MLIYYFYNILINNAYGILTNVGSVKRHVYTSKGFINGVLLSTRAMPIVVRKKMRFFFSVGLGPE